ncbi:lysozyme 2-like [Amphibalanus amphitrite]|uniref:lysozyme 2-like n=1 Tax=Amphibalanus amphitrite TaxID=1232801 RepID=UPI001C90B29E|nr:lysozyme 2-like [Amphibalanus amphitrite]XP_043241657.1 lysozyme 2-like [Amphibalanus amphitrite]
MKTCRVVLFAVLAAVAVVPATTQELVSSLCLGCICEASSACNTQLGCENGFCGPFRISNAFFIDSELSKEPNFAQYNFQSCTTDPFCSAAVIRKYMAKYPRDCDGDGQFTCKDYAMVHKAGPDGCTNTQRVRVTDYWRRFESCLSYFPNA